MVRKLFTHLDYSFKVVYTQKKLLIPFSISKMIFLLRIVSDIPVKQQPKPKQNKKRDFHK